MSDTPRTDAEKYRVVVICENCGTIDKRSSDALTFRNIKIERFERELAEAERLRPFMLLRPRLYPDGNQWCALYGDNLQDGVAGFGDTPEEAAKAFDDAWRSEKCGGSVQHD